MSQVFGTIGRKWTAGASRRQRKRFTASSRPLLPNLRFDAIRLPHPRFLPAR